MCVHARAHVCSSCADSHTVTPAARPYAEDSISQDSRPSFSSQHRSAPASAVSCESWDGGADVLFRPEPHSHLFSAFPPAASLHSLLPTAKRRRAVLGQLTWPSQWKIKGSEGADPEASFLFGFH